MLSFTGATGQNLKRLTGLLSVAQDWTILCQSRLLANSAPGDGTTVYVYGSRLSGVVVDYSAPFIWHGYTNNGSGQNFLEFEVFNVIPELQKTVVVGDCHWSALIYIASTHVFQYIVDGVVIGTTTFNMATHPLVIVCAGSDIENIGVAHDLTRYREWQAALSLAEVTLEANRDTALRTANLVTDTPLTDASDVTDHSGNGHDWTKSGTPTTTFACPSLVPIDQVPVNLPLVGRAGCAPQAQINGGGKGKAGCNTGGLGSLRCC